MSSTVQLCAIAGDVLSEDDGTTYRSLVIGLQYIALTRPYISYVVIEFASIFMILASHIGLPSNVFFGMFGITFSWSFYPTCTV
jgi:hypothetical protein